MESGELENRAMVAPDYMPVACNDTVAMWIFDRVRRHGPLDLADALAKIDVLFGRRFTVEVGRGLPALRKGVHLALRDLSKGTVVYDRRERRYRAKR